MRQSCAVLTAGLAACAGSLAMAVTGAAAQRTPTATTAPPPPRSGTYSGRTSQGLRFALSVAPSRTVLSSARFGFRVHCADHRTLEFTVAPILAQQPWRLDASGGTGFTRTFQDTTGERYWIRGRFSGADTVTGTLSTWWHSPHDGVCRSGHLAWDARLSR